MDRNEKANFIENFLEIIKQDGRVLRYISEENIRGILEEQISAIEYGDIEEDAWMAAYDGQERKLICRPEYKGNMPMMMHEIFHALTNNMQSTLTLGEQSLIMKSGFHFYYGGEGKKWYNQYEMGRGLNEGITQYLTRHIAGTIKDTNILKALGVNIIKDSSYPCEQQIVEELVVLYGEDAVLGAYFETSPQRLIRAIGESGAVKNPETVLTEIISRLDVHEMLERSGMLLYDDKSYKKEFSKIQKFITKELIEKEVSFALKSKDTGAVARVKQILENLQGLDVSLDGRNVFENVIDGFNSKVKSMPNGTELMIESSKEIEDKTQVDLTPIERMQISSLMQRNGSIKLLVKAINGIAKGMFQSIKKIQKTRVMKYDKNVKELIVSPREDITVNQSPPDEENDKEQKQEALIAAIRGCSKENYEKACQDSAQNWMNRREEDRGTRNSQIDR